MPLSPELQSVADELTALFREAQDDLRAKLAAILDDPNEVRQRARLNELLRTIDATATSLLDGTRTWLEANVAAVHAAGATAGAQAAGTAFAWSAPHVEAVQALAAQVWSEVAPNLLGMSTTTRQAIRDLTRASARDVLLEGQSAAGASRELERWMVDQGIGTVTYANGANHLVGDYADTLSRTVTANAYNEGTFTQAVVDGFEWMEVFDGPDCGWERHDDPDKANGTVRRLADCRSHSLSHPRCARNFAPRPDVASQAQADAGRNGEQQAVAAAVERRRAETATRTLTGRARAPRVARTPRQPRTRA